MPAQPEPNFWIPASAELAPGSNGGMTEGVSCMIAIIPAEAGIQKREQFFVTLHNTSWIRD